MDSVSIFILGKGCHFDRKIIPKDAIIRMTEPFKWPVVFNERVMKSFEWPDAFNERVTKSF